jgi:hypothetical protein
MKDNIDVLIVNNCKKIRLHLFFSKFFAVRKFTEDKAI